MNTTIETDNTYVDKDDAGGLTVFIDAICGSELVSAIRGEIDNLGLIG